MKYDLVIKDARIISADASYLADIAVQGEEIAAIGHSLKGAREVDARGKLVTPGAVDLHVHMQMPLGNLTSADDFYTGTRAAAFGGTTTIVDFVEPQPQETLREALEARREEADPKVVVDYGLHMTIGPAEIAKLEEIPGIVQAGVVSFKLYTAYDFRLSDAQLMRALNAISKAGSWAVIHAENWDVIQALAAENLSQGNTDPCWHPRSRPSVMEGEAAGRVIDIASLTGTRIHIFHVSCTQVVERIQKARAAGLPVTGETCPQYLLLTDEAYERPAVDGTLNVCSPPIRDADAQKALWLALERGDLQVVATDHCPFRRKDKESGLKDFTRIPGGVGSVEIRLSAIYDAGVRSGLLSMNQWVDLCCTTPARLAGLTHKGHILPGYHADLVIFDPEREITISCETLHEDVDWTPYAGMKIKGWPTMTISRGEVIVEGDDFIGKSGRGRFIKRRY